MKANKLTMSKTQLQKLKTQIRAQLNQIRFGPSKPLPPPQYSERSLSHRRHYDRTYSHIFKDVFNPKPKETIIHNNCTQKKHYQNPQITVSQRDIYRQKRHFRERYAGWEGGRRDKDKKVTTRKEMKELSRGRSRSVSQINLSQRLLTVSPSLLNMSSEKNEREIKENKSGSSMLKASSIYSKFY